jgi:hypothetical protein
VSEIKKTAYTPAGDISIRSRWHVARLTDRLQPEQGGENVAAWDSLLEKWSKPRLAAFGENDPVLGPGTGAQAVWQRCPAPRRGEGERRARGGRLVEAPCTTRGAGTNLQDGGGGTAVCRTAAGCGWPRPCSSPSTTIRRRQKKRIQEEKKRVVAARLY